MEPLERLEIDSRIAREKGARPELISKMEEQIAKMKLRQVREPKVIGPEEVYFPPDDENQENNPVNQEPEDWFKQQVYTDDGSPPF